MADEKQPGAGQNRDSFLARFSRTVTDWSGSSWAFALASFVIVAWLITGSIVP